MEQKVQEQLERHSPQAVQNKKKRWVKWISWIVTSCLALTLIVMVAISLKVGWSLTHPVRKALDDSPESYGLLYETIEINSAPDQITLQGWMIEADDPRGTIIMAHGYRGNRLETGVPALALAKELHTHGYHVLMFDFRNSGESEGDLTTVGYKEKEDLLSAVQFAKNYAPDVPIGVIGFSMGASTAIVASAEEPLIEAVIADSPFSDLRVYLESNLPYWSDLPHFPFTFIIMNTLPLLTGIDVDEVSPRKAMESLDTPVLLIHGAGDEAIPYQNSEEIYSKAKSGNAELWIPEGSDHVKSYADHSEEYLHRVLQFLEQSGL